MNKPIIIASDERLLVEGLPSITVSGDAKPAQAAGIIFQAPDDRVLFLKRGPNSDHPGTWAFPGGGVEDGETEEEAARREANEETGVTDPGELKKVHRQKNDEVSFTTFQASVGEQFLPKLNDEHVAHSWAPLNDPPLPLHPGVAAMIESGTATDAAFAFDWVSSPRVHRAPLALDRATVRRIDQDGRMHVELTNISKANVCPYLGREIPQWRELGLTADRIYQLYRDPEELAKAVPTFNNVPLLSQHVEVSADDHQPDFVVGSTGTDASFKFPYLRNSLVIWAKGMIQAVDSGDQKQLSGAYRYRADMTPGTTQDGIKFDGVMRDIIGNHVALVKEGRAGADVVVGDSKEDIIMAVKGLSPKAMLTQGALSVYLRPKLAADAKLNILPAIKSLTQKNFKAKKPVLAAWIKEATEGKLAKDADIGDVVELLDQLESIDAPDIIESATGGEVVSENPTDDKDADPKEAFLKSKLSDEDWAQYQQLNSPAHEAGVDVAAGAAKSAVPLKTAAQDAENDKKDKEPPITKAAMDAAIRESARAATAAATKIQQEIRVAEKEVQPYVGELKTAFDSAEQVYRTTLEMLGVEGAKEIHVSALPTILKMQPLPGAKKAAPHVAADAKPGNVVGFAARFPGANKISNA